MSTPQQGQQPFPQPPIMPSGPMPSSGATARKPGFLDTGFTRFLSLTLISVWWVVALVVIAIATVVGVIGGFVQMRDSVGIGLLWVVGSLVGSVVAVVLTRLFLESVAVLFRIADNTSELARRP